MRWKTGRRSRDIEDRRNSPLPGRSRMPFPRVGRRGMRRGGGLSFGMIAIIVVIGLITGQNPLQMLGMIMGGGGGMPVQMAESQGVPLNPSANDQDAEFVSVVLADTEDTWHKLFSQAGSRYQVPKLVLYNDLTRTACGLGQAASGHFIVQQTQKCTST